MSKKFDPKTDSGQPLVYQIKIEGHLGRQWAEWFDGLTITLQDNGDTLLSGPVIDQAALHGLLRKVRDLGLPLVSVNRVKPLYRPSQPLYPLGENQMTTRTDETSYRIYARVAGFTYYFYLVAGIASLVLADRPHATDVLSLLTSFSALVLGVTLYAITREQGPALAMLALTCRIIEAAPGEGTIYFAVGNLFFSWLMLRGRMIPVALAWLGVLASVLLVVILPLQLAGLFGGSMTWSSSITWLTFLPMLVFELTLGLWLIIKGVAVPVTNVAPPRTNQAP